MSAGPGRFPWGTDENRELTLIKSMAFKAMLRLMLGLALAPELVAPRLAKADELCRFTGSTDYRGHVDVTSRVADESGMTRVDIALSFTATTMIWLHWHYLIEEISFWRAGEMQSVAMNTRDFVGGHVVRQFWDVFRRTKGGLEGQRLQGKTAEDFAQRHPGFARHWDPADFGTPWLADFASGAPERRPDLDLKPAPADIQAPLALAFYWDRFLPPKGVDEKVFLPGYKIDKVIDLPMSGDRGALQTELHYSAFLDQPISVARAAISADRHVQWLDFSVHGTRGSASGRINGAGCSNIRSVR